MNEQDIIKEAKRRALKWLNESRKSLGKPPLRRVEPLWFRIHGVQFVNEVMAEQNKD